MKKAIGAILIIGAIILGYFGVRQFQASTNEKEIGIGDLKVEVGQSDKGGQTSGYIMIGLAVVACIGGIVLVAQKDK